MSRRSESWAIDIPAWRGSDAIARLTDFLRRKTGAASEEWSGFLERIEECASPAQLRRTLRAIIGRITRRRAAQPAVELDPAEVEFEHLCEAILASGHESSLEGYTSYLFELDCKIQL